MIPINATPVEVEKFKHSENLIKAILSLSHRFKRAEENKKIVDGVAGKSVLGKVGGIAEAKMRNLFSVKTASRLMGLAPGSMIGGLISERHDKKETERNEKIAETTRAEKYAKNFVKHDPRGQKLAETDKKSALKEGVKLYEQQKDILSQIERLEKEIADARETGQSALIEKTHSTSLDELKKAIDRIQGKEENRESKPAKPNSKPFPGSTVPDSDNRDQGEGESDEDYKERLLKLNIEQLRQLKLLVKNTTETAEEKLEKGKNLLGTPTSKNKLSQTDANGAGGGIISSLLAGLGPIMGLITGGAGALLKKVTGPILRTGSKVLAEAGRLGMGALRGAGTLGMTALRGVGGVGTAAINALKVGGTTVANGAKAVGTAGTTVASNVANGANVASTVGTAAKAVGTAGANIASTVANGAKAVGTAGANVASTVGTAGANIASNVASTVANGAKAVGTAGANVASTVANGAKAVGTAGANIASKASSSIMGGLAKIGTGAASSIMPVASSAAKLLGKIATPLQIGMAVGGSVMDESDGKKIDSIGKVLPEGWDLLNPFQYAMNAGRYVGNTVNEGVAAVTGKSAGNTLYDGMNGAKSLFGMESDEEKAQKEQTKSEVELAKKKVESGQMISVDLAQKAAAGGYKVPANMIKAPDGVAPTTTIRGTSMTQKPDGTWEPTATAAATAAPTVIINGVSMTQKPDGTWEPTKDKEPKNSLAAAPISTNVVINGIALKQNADGTWEPVLSKDPKMTKEVITARETQSMELERNQIRAAAIEQEKAAELPKQSAAPVVVNNVTNNSTSKTTKLSSPPVRNFEPSYNARLSNGFS